MDPFETSIIPKQSRRGFFFHSSKFRKLSACFQKVEVAVPELNYRNSGFENQ